MSCSPVRRIIGNPRLRFCCALRSQSTLPTRGLRSSCAWRSGLLQVSFLGKLNIDQFDTRATVAFRKTKETSMNTSPLEQLRRSVERESIDGAKLLENPNDNPICSLCYDKTVRCVTIVWRRYATSAQYRFIHEAIIQMLQQYQASKILGDDSDLPVVHAEDQQWIIENWIPRAKAAGLKAVATNRSLSFFGRLTIGSIQARMAGEVAIRTFPSVHLAKNWLRNFSD